MQTAGLPSQSLLTLLATLSEWHKPVTTHQCVFTHTLSPHSPPPNSIIEQPMDMGTIQQRLQQGKVATLYEFATLIYRVYDNAMAFNRAGSVIHKLAASLRALAADLLTALAVAAAEGGDEATRGDDGEDKSSGRRRASKRARRRR